MKSHLGGVSVTTSSSVLGPLWQLSDYMYMQPCWRDRIKGMKSHLVGTGGNTASYCKGHLLLELQCVIWYEKRDRIAHFMAFAFTVLWTTTLPPLHVAVCFTLAKCYRCWDMRPQSPAVSRWLFWENGVQTLDFRVVSLHSVYSP